MSHITEKDVRHVAKLSRLALTDEEVQKYQGQLERILGHISELSKKNTDNVPPTAHPFEVGNVWREDVARKYENIEGLFKNAPEVEESFYRVKKVIE
jgi:aspartyl-tRNA(Asn)/glutamyl-tRNA(Gln) amidotransferase subunit C